MKKFLSCLLALLMTASLLAGCGQQKTDDYNGGDVTEPALADGVYTADFNTDSSMFHANETCDGKGVLTVKDGQMTIHVSLALADGTYTIEVGFEGGSGKSHVQTPCTLKVENGAATATIVWSSEKYDYMLVDGQRYDVLTTEGGSTFEIPVRALDTPLTVIGDTTAMSTPHEIEYTLTFDSATAVEAAQ